MKRVSWLVSIALLGVVASPLAQAANMPEYQLVVRNQRFAPPTLKVPANTKFKVLVTNQDGTPSELESSDFKREEIVPPGRTVTVFVGPAG